MKTRRRGKELETALLEAAWAELIENGYANLTMEAVAARAGTSRPVIARRWDGKAPLAIAAIQQRMSQYPLEVTDHGDIRAELLDFLEQASKRARGIAGGLATMFTLFTCGHCEETSYTLEEFRSALAARDSKVIEPILERAMKRGEIDPQKVIPPVTSLIGDLFRYHLIMNLAPPPVQLRETWVDALFLPLVLKDGGRKNTDRT